MFQKEFLSILPLFFSIVLSGCSTTGTASRFARLAAQHSLSERLVDTGSFTILTFYRITDRAKPAYIYIEGDGAAWESKKRASLDPTPSDRLVLSLIASDSFPNVIYIARPCQYTGYSLNPSWNKKYWTDARFSHEVISSLDIAINAYTQEYSLTSVYLVGYSGGGAIAVLLAARRDDVRGIITIAGNLDHRSFTTIHAVTPLSGSENPIDYAKKVAGIPQIHLAGTRDKIIPEQITDHFMQTLNADARAKKVVCETCTHHTGWEAEWRKTLSEYRDEDTGGLKLPWSPHR